ncbi:chromosome partitioning protein ParA (plasmid) [Burkholderia cenocepacia]|uniref:chromosome partitioning protein ParA n=1 Tax=Burkholderia cenocepacia TaxID=95486 RepID=UPI001F1E0014|nr:chromosome partitioning protein ParA [Burkholderia cenocepacia]UJH75049.1 chromosome partitioning protein ParA [Burkholderia cenocepacia]
MDFATPHIHQQGNSLHVSHGDDSGLFVEFSLEPIHQEAESEKQGRPIYKDVAHIRIHFAGDRTKMIFRPVKMEDDQQGPSDPRRFPRQWAAFQEQRSQVQEGTPLEQWPPLSRSEVMSMKAMHIHTVEQLAAMADSNLSWLGARELREKAIAWLKNAEGGKEVVRLTAENEQLRADLDAQREQTKELAERLDALSARMDAGAGDAAAPARGRRAATAE